MRGKRNKQTVATPAEVLGWFALSFGTVMGLVQWLGL